MEQNMRFGMVLGQLAVLKILDWAVKYATFRTMFLCFHGQYVFLNILASALKSCIT